jgi:hypothetical protein
MPFPVSFPGLQEVRESSRPSGTLHTSRPGIEIREEVPRAKLRNAATGPHIPGATAWMASTIPNPTTDSMTFIAVHDLNVCATVIPKY